MQNYTETKSLKLKITFKSNIKDWEIRVLKNLNDFCMSANFKYYEISYIIVFDRHKI